MQPLEVILREAQQYLQNADFVHPKDIGICAAFHVALWKNMRPAHHRHIWDNVEIAEEQVLNYWQSMFRESWTHGFSSRLGDPYTRGGRLKRIGFIIQAARACR